MKITVPQEFWHAGDLSGRNSSIDPRLTTSGQSSLDVDLRKCDFVRPPALLWCAVYVLLARSTGRDVRLLVPENTGAAVYLKSANLFGLLQADGVEVDDRGIGIRRDRKIVLPLTQFHTEQEVEDLANAALESMSESGLAAANLYTVVSEVFAELAMNAVQHSESRIGAFGLIQFYGFEKGRRFICVVADGGIGIRSSLERNPALRDKVPYDWVAIELALRERVSGTGESTRGIGLYGIAEDMRKPGRHLFIHSGIGSVETTEELESEARRTTLFPGTSAFAAIPA